MRGAASISPGLVLELAFGSGYEVRHVREGAILQAQIEKWMSVAGEWDEPQIDSQMLGQGRIAE